MPGTNPLHGRALNFADLGDPVIFVLGVVGDSNPAVRRLAARFTPNAVIGIDGILFLYLAPIRSEIPSKCFQKISWIGTLNWGGRCKLPELGCGECVHTRRPAEAAPARTGNRAVSRGVAYSAMRIS